MKVAIQNNQIEQLSYSTPELEALCSKFKKMGYENNESLHNLKFEKTLADGGSWFVFRNLDDNVLWGIAGIQKFDDYYPNSWRMFYRTAVLPRYSMKARVFTSLKTCLNTFQWFYVGSVLCAWAYKLHNQSQIYVTSNTLHGQGAKSSTVGRLILKPAAEQGYMTLVDTAREIYSTPQDVYKVDQSFFIQETKRQTGFDSLDSLQVNFQD